MITALIFDLDGLLADTEKLHRRAHQEVLAGYGIELSSQQYKEHWIRDGKGIIDFISEHGLSLDPAVLRPKKIAKYEALVRSSAQAMPGAQHALDTLRPHKTLALATSSYRESAMVVLDTLGIRDHFACIAAKGDAARTKPFPDIFLYAATRLGVDPAECLVLEDAEKGIVAADAAGMRCVAIPNDETRDNDFSRATAVLSSLDELTLEKIEELDRTRPAGGSSFPGLPDSC